MATGFKEVCPHKGSDYFLSDCMQPVFDWKGNSRNDGSEIDLKYDIDDDDVTGSVQLGNEDNSPESGKVNMSVNPSATTKKTEKKFQISVTINSDIIKFISKRKKFSQELSERLSQLNAEAELIPEKSLINVTKKGFRRVPGWHKRSTGTVTSFCKRFDKVCFEVKESTLDLLLKSLPKLGATLRSSSAAYWIEASGNNLVVITEQKEREYVLKKVREFLQISDEDDNFEGHTSDVRKEKPSKQLQTTLKIDGDIVKFLMKRKKYSEQLKELLSQCGAEFKLNSRGRPGLFVIKKVDSSPIIENWVKLCQDRVNVFCSSFNKRDFPVDDSIRVSISKDLSTLQKSVSSTGAACWFDTHKKKLILVSPKVGFIDVVEEVKEFIQRFDNLAEKSFEIEESIYELVKTSLPKLITDEALALKSCSITLNDKTLVVVCLRNEIENAVAKVESFLQEFGRLRKETQISIDAAHPLKSTVNGSDTSSVNLSRRNKNSAGSITSREEETPQFAQQIVTVVDVATDHIKYLKQTQFLELVKHSHPGITEAAINEGRNQIRFVGSSDEISAAGQKYDQLVKELNVTLLQLPHEAMKFVSQRAGLAFIEKCLSDSEIISVILVESKSSVKIVARSAQECENVKECLCKNVRQATIKVPLKNEHIFATKVWYDLLKAIESEELVDYQVNFINETRHEVKLHGATFLVEKYDKIVQDYIKSQKIESSMTRLPSGIARFLKEKLSKDLENIEANLKEEQVKIVIDSGRLEYMGTMKGINESKRQIMNLRGIIKTTRKDYASVGVNKLFFNEDGGRNIKGIEAVGNVIIEVDKDDAKESTTKVSTSANVDAMQKVVSEVPMAPFDQCNFTTREGLKVSWKYGNIAQERSDILVSSATANLTQPTMMGRVLISAGGTSFFAACSQHTNIGTGEIATTIGGNLPCNYVIHAVCCGWNTRGSAEQLLRGLLLKILDECNRLSARSVAMPLIGTGKHKFPDDVVLRVMKEVFAIFSSTYPHSTLKEIKLVRYDAGIGQNTAPTQSIRGPIKPMPMISRTRSTAFVPLVACSGVKRVQVWIFARSTEDSSSAFVDIEKFIQSHITKMTVEYEKLAEVVVGHWNELKRLANDNELRITCINATTVSIEGMLSEVVVAKEKLLEMVNRCMEEERRSNQFSYISKNVQWYYTDQRSGREVAYSSQLNGTIESAHMEAKAMVEIVDLDGLQYDVDFTQMVARKKGSYQTRKITRKLIGSEGESSLPSNWSHQREDQVVSLIPIVSSTPEYLEVVNHFVVRGGRADQLYKVERIQNPRLYSAFLAVKKSMRGQGNELRLFHGTDAANTDSINAHNFSRSFAGVNGTAFGNGVYFARDASYSMGYAQRQYSGARPKMYIAKVLVGNYTKGAKGMKAPPSKNDPYNPGVRYDSVVDNPSNPSMYIIFQDNQCYPEYLLTLRQ